MTCVLDAGPMIALLDGEAGADVVQALLADAANTCCAHAVTMCEVYYHFLRKADEATAQQAVADLLSLNVSVREDMDTALWQQAGRLKVAHRLSFADTFCIALAMRVGGKVVTTDHHEMDPLVPLGLCPIQFIR